MITLAWIVMFRQHTASLLQAMRWTEKVYTGLVMMRSEGVCIYLGHKIFLVLMCFAPFPKLFQPRNLLDFVKRQ